MNTDEMIREMAKVIDDNLFDYCDADGCINNRQLAKTLVNAGYRKVAVDEIVVKKSEYEDLSKDYATINDEAYYCGFSAGVEEAKQETRDILHDLYMCFTEEYLLGFRNSNKDHKSASVVKRLCKAYGIELE